MRRVTIPTLIIVSLVISALNVTSVSRAQAECVYGKDVPATFFETVLIDMGLPISNFALDAFEAWKSRENTQACWNPLATKFDLPGEQDTCFNSVCVRNYPDGSTGSQATAKTINLSYYTAVRNMLRQESFERDALISALNTWTGSGGYGAALVTQWENLWNARSIKGKVPYVILDPGHGGSDPGSPNSDLADLCGVPSGNGEIMEKDITLGITKLVKDKLVYMGLRVGMTRIEDVTVSRPDRIKLINREKPDLSVSIHTNSGSLNPIACGDGVEAWYSSKLSSGQPNPNVDASQHLAQSLAIKINESLNLRLRRNNGIEDAINHHLGCLDLVCSPIVPSALIETAHISNPIERQLLINRQEDFAQAIYEAIIENLPGFVVNRGLNYLRQQHAFYPNRSWSNNVGITGLATLAFLNHGYDESDPDVQSAIQYLLSAVKPDGSIYFDYYSQTYETSMAVLALKATNNPTYADEIARAKDWLVNSQWDDQNLWWPVDESSWYWGGFGYGHSQRPDMSNTQFALLALDAADLSKTESTWAKAVRFVSRSQNRRASNDGYSYYDDGGFNYIPSIVGCITPSCLSYGGATGAGIWGLALAGLTPSDPRFSAALNWVESNYSWDYNPLTGSSWGDNSLYYYYLSMSKALSMSRKSRIGDHDWHRELSEKLRNLQRGDGSWFNDNGWLWEGNPELATSYAILALQTRQLPPQADLELVIILHSPADLHLYDAFGQHVGKNYTTGQVDLEIPGSSYSETDPQTIRIHPPTAGNYHMELVGTGEGPWQLEILGYQDGLQVSYESYTGAIQGGVVLATDLNVGAFEGGLTIFSTQPAAAAVMDVAPADLSLTGSPGTAPNTSFTVAETGDSQAIQGVSIFAGDLVDGFGNVIPGSNVSFDPAAFDLPAGTSQEILVSVSIPSNLPDGIYAGLINVESLNAGTKSIQLSVEVTSNTQPAAAANGPYTVSEGGSAQLAGSGSDPDNDPLTYAWDLDNDGVFETLDQTAIFSAANLDGPSSQAVALQVCDDKGACATDSAIVEITNVAPSVGAFAYSPQTIYMGDPVSFAGTGYSDPAAADTHTGLWSWGDGASEAASLSAGAVAGVSHIYTAPGIYTVRLTLTDDDGGSGYAETTVTVLPVCSPASVRDNFNRANGGIGANWLGSRGGYKIKSQQMDVETGGPVYWGPATYGADQSACITFAKVDPKGQHQSLLLKAQGNSYTGGTIAVFYNALTGKIGVETYVPRQGWKTVAQFARTLVDGDRLSARALADGSVRVYVNEALVGEANAGAFFAGKGGRIGLWFIVAANAVLDDFGGGTLTP